MKTASIFTAALVISIMSFGSLKPIMPKSASRSPAVEKQAFSLKKNVTKYLVSVVK